MLDDIKIAVVRRTSRLMNRSLRDNVVALSSDIGDAADPALERVCYHV